MTITETTDKKTVSNRGDIVSITQPWHVRVVSIGAFLLLASMSILIVDLFTNTLLWWMSYDLIGIYYYTVEAFVLSFRVLGIVLFVMIIWIGFLGKPLYSGRPGRIMQKLLFLGVNVFLYIHASIGVGILATIALFLWTPRILLDKKPGTIELYRAVVMGGTLTWMILEILLSELLIGVTFWPQLLTLSLASILITSGLGVIILGSAFVLIPTYLLLPKLMVSLWRFRPNIESFWKEYSHEPMGIIGLIIVSSIILIAILAPWLAPYGYSEAPYPFTLEDLYQPPSPEHILGTNHNGEDIYSRLLYGAQISLLVGFTASIGAVFLGTFVGLISGYFGGLLDTALMRITDVFLCLPTLPLMLIFLVLFGQGMHNIIIVIAILSWTGTARMVRSEALSLRERPLTEAAHALGASDTYILIKHILPNTLPLILANVILGVVGAILSEAGIAFLGFANIHGQPSWGIILHWASRSGALLSNSWWWIIPPGLFIMLTTLGFTFVSHAADRVVNPRLRGRKT